MQSAPKHCIPWVLNAYVRAGETLRALPLTGVPAGYRSWWPSIVAEPTEARPEDDAPRQRKIATKEDIAHLDRVLEEWACVLDRQEHTCLMGYGLGIGTGKIAKQCHISRPLVYVRWATGCRKIAEEFDPIVC